MKTIPGGILIAVEGIDGAGKTTLARALAEDFRRAGFDVDCSKEPTNGPHGAQIRASAASGRLDVAEEMRLLLLDRRQHVHEVINPALERGAVVILDRYYPSSAAYQGAAGVPVAEVLEANDFAPKPDIVLLLDVSPQTGLARIHARGDAPNHFETVKSLDVARGIFRTMPLDNRYTLNAEHDAESVHKAAQYVIKQVLAEKLVRVCGLNVEAAETMRDCLPALT